MFLFLSLENANIHILFKCSGVLGEIIEYFGLLRRRDTAKAVFPFGFAMWPPLENALNQMLNFNIIQSKFTEVKFGKSLVGI